MSPLVHSKSSLWALAGIITVAVSTVFFLVHGNPLKSRGEPNAAELANDRVAGFRDLAQESGIHFRMAFLPNEQGQTFKTNLYDHGCGVAVGDFDGDGYDDIFFCNQLGKCALYRNKGDGTFEDVTEEAGVGLGDRICVAATWADYDNDGLQDLFVTSTRGGNVLFKNLGNGKFKDVTKEAGLTYVGHCQTAVFFDYDNDGYLDLLVTNTARWTSDDYDQQGRYYPGVKDLFGLARSPKEYNVLYHNNRDGTFTNVTDKSGLKGLGWGGDVAVFDFDEDGWMDLAVTNMFGRSQLYRNNRDGTFSDVSREALGRTSFGAVGCKAFDFNNDGRLDLFIVDMHSDMWVINADSQTLIIDEKRKYSSILGPLFEVRARAQELEKDYNNLLQVRKDEVVFGNTLFKNQGGGRFLEISDKAGMETWWPWGIATGDFDNDGYEDAFIPSGMGYPFRYWRNYLMMNNGNETFTDRSLSLGIEPPAKGIFLEESIGNRPATRSSRCAAVADFDGDGRLEIITNNFNDRPYYFKNNFPRKNYIAFRLRGTKSNRDAIGAVVRLHVGKEVMTRQVNPAGGYLSQSSKMVHFGLGDRPRVERVEITWPGGHKQTLEGPAINQLHAVTESAR